MRTAGTIGVIMMLLTTTSAFSQSYLAGFGQSLVTSGISNPTVMAFAPDGRIFVASQGGQLRVIKNGTLLATPFVELTVTSTGERGLIGIALDPGFGTNGFVYLYYTVPGSPAHNRISRFTAIGDVAVAGSEMVLLDIDPLSTATNHNGGALEFGPDGKLYVAVGDNASGANAQNLDTHKGKILRINPDGSVPAGNPFASGSEQKKRVWAYGLRNPYTISFQPGTGKLFVNDVGEVTWEEINDATTGGHNFGWPTAEGMSTNPNFINPLYTYAHGTGDGVGCAVTGGTFFNPSSTNYPSTYYGKYFFLDYCAQWINAVDPVAATVVRIPFATAISGATVIIRTGNDGNLYYLSRSASSLYKIIYSNASAPFITTHPADVQVTEESTATFTVQAIGSSPFTYQWQKDNVDIAGATNSTLTLAHVQPANAGQYRVIVSNGAGNATSTAATLTVNAVNDLPVATITSPVEGTLYSAGAAITFSGTGTDIEDGDLSASAFTWQIDFHHATHVHDQPAITGITSGTYNVPNEGETSDDVWYRIILTVKDSDGLSSLDSVDVFPRKSTLTFTTNPPGIPITLDGQPFATPGSVVSVEGILRTIEAVTPQTLDGIEYEFSSWSNDGSIAQTILTPVEDITYTANFSIVTGLDADRKVAVQFYPNPAEGEIVVMNIRSSVPGAGTIRIADVLSRSAAIQSFPVIAGDNSIEIPVNTLGKGMYVATVEVGGRKIQRKLIIR